MSVSFVNSIQAITSKAKAKEKEKYTTVRHDEAFHVKFKKHFNLKPPFVYLNHHIVIVPGGYKSGGGGSGSGGSDSSDEDSSGGGKLILPCPKSFFISFFVIQ
jgi:hypothetical protein